jgi:hypothetical protein
MTLERWLRASLSTRRGVWQKYYRDREAGIVSLFKPDGLAQLLERPGGAWMGGDIAMDQAPAAMLNCHKHIQQTKGRGDGHEEIAGNDPLRMVSARKLTSANHLSADLADGGADTCSRSVETPESRFSTATHWRSNGSALQPPEQLPSCSMPADQRHRTHDNQRTAPIEESRQQSQTDPRGRIDPSRLRAALGVERRLSTQKQILGLDRLARSKGEPKPPKHVGPQIDQDPRNPQHYSIMPQCPRLSLMIGGSAAASDNCGAQPGNSTCATSGTTCLRIRPSRKPPRQKIATASRPIQEWGSIWYSADCRAGKRMRRRTSRLNDLPRSHGMS